MKLFKTTFLFIISLVSLQAFSQYTEVINSNRPGASHSAFSVGTNVMQFELGSYMIKEKRTPAPSYEVEGFGVDFALRYGLLWEPLEINVEGNFQNDTKTLTNSLTAEEDRANFKFLTVGVKVLIYDPHKNAEYEPNLYSWKANQAFKWRYLIPAVSIYVGGNIDTKDNPYTAPNTKGFSPKFMLATQQNLSGGWVFVMNFIQDRISTDQSEFQYILTLTHSFTPQWIFFAETQGIKSDFYADNLFKFGAGYLVNRNFQLDAAATFNTKNTPSVLGFNLGMSYRLDFHKDKE